MRLAALWCGASALVVRQQPTRRRLRIAPRMAVSEIAMPALSSTMTSGRVVSWLVGKGDKVEAGDPVMVVESDKADMEVESFEEGYVAAIVVDEGSDADVGVAVGYLAETAEEAAAEPGAPAARRPRRRRRRPARAQRIGDDAGAVVDDDERHDQSSSKCWRQGRGRRPRHGRRSDKADMEVESSTRAAWPPSWWTRVGGGRRRHRGAPRARRSSIAEIAAFPRRAAPTPAAGANAGPGA